MTAFCLIRLVMAAAAFLAGCEAPETPWEKHLKTCETCRDSEKEMKPICPEGLDALIKTLEKQ